MSGTVRTILIVIGVVLALILAIQGLAWLNRQADEDPEVHLGQVHTEGQTP